MGFDPRRGAAFSSPGLFSGILMQKTYVYIDGFNLYYRGIKNSPYKWLDLKSLCQKVLNNTHKIEGIKYFTAIVSGKIDPQKPIKQQIYMNWGIRRTEHLTSA